MLQEYSQPLAGTRLSGSVFRAQPAFWNFARVAARRTAARSITLVGASFFISGSHACSCAQSALGPGRKDLGFKSGQIGLGVVCATEVEAVVDFLEDLFITLVFQFETGEVHIHEPATLIT